MKNNKIEIVSCIIMISSLVIMMILSCFYMMFPKVLSKLNLTNDNTNKFFNIVNTNPSINIDYKKMYPFETSKEENISRTNIVDKYSSFINNIKVKLENYTSSNLLKYEKMIELSYTYNDLIHFKLVPNFSDTSRINLGDGYYSSIYKKTNTEILSNNLIEFNGYLQSQNIDLLYVQAPFKISSDQKMLSIYKDYTNENMDNFLKQIDEKTNYIDLRKNIKNADLNHLNMFYKTDHHWLPETGLWAAGEISSYINSNYDLNLKTDNIDPQNFEYINYPNMFLGSDGRNVSLKNAIPEDFTLIIPNFKTKLNVKIPELNIDKTGEYKETILDMSQCIYANYYKINQYTTYAYGDRGLIEIYNESVNNDKKILLIKDSFSDVVIPFLSLETAYVSAIDLRHFNGSLKSYIREYNPDIVVVMYNGSVFKNIDSDIIKMWDFE